MTWTTRPRSRLGALGAICAGAGPRVVLIHGVGLRAEAWGGQIEALARAFRVVAIDIPGHGHSAQLAEDPRLADFTDAIVRAIPEPAVVIGHSFGAMIALDMAGRYPHRVLGVAALNAVFQRDAAAKQAVMTRAECLDATAVADPSAPLGRWFGDAPSAARAACRDWLCGVDPAGYRDAYRVFAAEDGPSELSLKDLHCPALFVTGEEEPNSTPHMSRRMADLTPRGRAMSVKGAAHMMPMTHAAEVTAILNAFIMDHAI